MNEIQFARSLPYPSIDDIVPNGQDLRLMRNNYAGVISELSAITQYVFHQLHAKENDFTEIGKSLLSIAQVEMRHLNILGGVIGKLGGNPKFMYHNGCQMAYWNGGMIDDHCQIKTMLQKDIKLEQETIYLYSRQEKEVSQPTIAKILQRLILDEELHIEYLNTMLIPFL